MAKSKPDYCNCHHVLTGPILPPAGAAWDSTAEPFSTSLDQHPCLQRSNTHSKRASQPRRVKGTHARPLGGGSALPCSSYSRRRNSAPGPHETVQQPPPPPPPPPASFPALLASFASSFRFEMSMIA
eukprot:2174447-Pleurochrysis_carterae.AAC.1